MFFFSGLIPIIDSRWNWYFRTDIFLHPSSHHPSIPPSYSAFSVLGAAVWAGKLRTFIQHLREDPKCIVTPVCPWSSRGPPPGGTYRNTSRGWCPGGIQKRLPTTPQLALTSAGSCGGAAAILCAPPRWQSSSPISKEATTSLWRKLMLYLASFSNTSQLYILEEHHDFIWYLLTKALLSN